MVIKRHKSRAKLSLVTPPPNNGSPRVAPKASEVMPWLDEPGMKAIFRKGLALLPSQPQEGQPTKRLLCAEGAFSFFYTGTPCSEVALTYWRRLVMLAGKHQGNRSRGAVRLPPDDEVLLKQLASLCIILKYQGNGEYFSNLVPFCHYNFDNRLAIFELSPVFAAFERENTANLE